MTYFPDWTEDLKSLANHGFQSGYFSPSAGMFRPLDEDYFVEAEFDGVVTPEDKNFIQGYLKDGKFVRATDIERTLPDNFVGSVSKSDQWSPYVFHPYGEEGDSSSEEVVDSVTRQGYQRGFQSTTKLYGWYNDGEFIELLAIDDYYVFSSPSIANATAVPEPSSALALMLALTGLAGFRRFGSVR